jgi:hypothetical protein
MPAALFLVFRKKIGNLQRVRDGKPLAMLAPKQIASKKLQIEAQK